MSRNDDAFTEQRQITVGAVEQMCRDLACAGRILNRHGIIDAFGHVSARHPEFPERFLMAERMSAGLTRSKHIRTFGPNAELVLNDGSPVFLERFIHSAIYLARPDVRAVVHTHSPLLVSFSLVTGKELKPVYHMSGFINDPLPIYEIRNTAGEGSDLLIRNHHLGAALASCLGSASMVLMRGHGSTVVGNSIAQTVYRAIYAELNAKIQCAATALGEIRFLTVGEAVASSVAVDMSLDRIWRMWCDEIGPFEI